MRNEPNLRIENYRFQGPTFQSERGKNWGWFFIPGKFGTLKVISGGFADHPKAQGWEHVSVSYADRIPCWEDMDKVKHLFWNDEETVIQFHPSESQKINCHPYTLHLWKPTEYELVLPPEALI
jgi:hypothetical protein